MKYTVWVFPKDLRPLKFGLPRPLVLFLLPLTALAFGCLVLVPFLLSDYLKTRQQLIEVRAELDERTRTYGERIEKLTKELAELKEFDRRLRIMANLEPTGQEIFAVGGAEEKDAFAEIKGSLDKKVLDELLSEAEAQKRSFRELYSVLKKKRHQLSCTPSIWPTRGWVSSGYGYRIDPFTGLRQFHHGLDISNRIGTPIIAPADGIVARIWRDRRLGLSMKISHGYGITTIYGHLHKVFVKVGQRVKRGQRIALMGNTGRSTGPHLHYEVRLNGVPVNPRRYILN